MPSDSGAAALVTRSLVFRAASALMRRAGAIVSQSSTAAALHTLLRQISAWPVHVRARATGTALVAASAVHAVMVAFVPRASAPAWRFAAPILVAIIGVAMIASARTGGGEARRPPR
jgi:hypothetical protein